MTDSRMNAASAPDPRTQTSSKYTPATAIAVVVANMVGTGVFTSLGYQIIDIKSTFVLLMLWPVSYTHLTLPTTPYV